MENYIKKLEEALKDVLGNCKEWEDIHYNTNLSEERSKEISNLYKKILNNGIEECKCESRAELLGGDIGRAFWVACSICNLEGEMSSYEEQAIELWNTMIGGS